MQIKMIKDKERIIIREALSRYEAEIRVGNLQGVFQPTIDVHSFLKLVKKTKEKF